FPTSIVAVTVLVAVSITETVLQWVIATYTFVPSGVSATPTGLGPTGIVAVTLFVETSITETLLKYFPLSVTYAFVPSGLNATPEGAPSTFTVAVTALVAVSITEMLPLLEFATYTLVPSG